MAPMSPAGAGLGEVTSANKPNHEHLVGSAVSTRTLRAGFLSCVRSPPHTHVHRNTDLHCKYLHGTLNRRSKSGRGPLIPWEALPFTPV